MVTISKIIERTNKDGSTFKVAEIVSATPVLVKSAEGNVRMEIGRTTTPFPAANDIDTSLANQLFVGSEVTGHIIREACAPYEYKGQEYSERWVLVMEDPE